MPVSPLLAFALVGVAVVGLIAWLVVSQRRKQRAEEAALEALGFYPCDVAELVTRIHPLLR